MNFEKHLEHLQRFDPGSSELRGKAPDAAIVVYNTLDTAKIIAKEQLNSDDEFVIMRVFEALLSVRARLEAKP